MPKLIMMRISKDITGTRAFPRGDAQHDRHEAVRSELRLPYQERIRLKKLAQRRMKTRQQRAVTPLKVGILNVGTLTGQGMELVDMMERRKINVLCLRETKWKGQKARGMGNGYKLYYNGVDGRRNGAGIVLDPELKKGVLSVSRESDRLIWIKMEINKVAVNVVSAYTPQQGCDEEEEKEEFWDLMDEVMGKIPGNEIVWLGGNLNGHIGQGNAGVEEITGKVGSSERNATGEKIVDFAMRNKIAILNTYFKKEVSRRTTYKSGGNTSQVDYLLCRRDQLKHSTDCTVLPGESVAKQHRLVICKIELQTQRQSKQNGIRKTK